MTAKCEHAKTTLKTNFKRMANRVGLKWTPADDEELDRAIDEIFAETVMAAKREVFRQLANDRWDEERRKIQESFQQ